MDRNVLRTCGLLGLAWAISLGLVSAGEERSAGYLAKTGPAALRFQKVPPQNLSSLPPLPKDDAKASDTNDQLAKWPGTPLFPLILVSPAPAIWTPPYANPQVNVPGAFNPYSMLPPSGYGMTNAATSSPTANELLAITPQMLVEYFRPLNGSTNSAGVSVFMPVPFTPATPAASPSSATYRAQ